MGNEQARARRQIASGVVLIHVEHADMARRLRALEPCCATCRFWITGTHACSRRELDDGEPNNHYGKRTAASLSDMVRWCHEPIDVLKRGST